MSYTSSRVGRRGLGAIGAPNPARATQAADLAQKAKSTVQAIQSGVVDTVTLISQLVQDPALPEVACRVGQLYALENGKLVPVCPSPKRSNQRGGIGLRQAVPAMRAWVFAKQNPWAAPLAGVAVIGVPVLIGYLLGKASR